MAHRPRRAQPTRTGVATVRAVHADEPWQVVTVPGAAARKTYRCPGCNQPIPPGTPHLVLWPTDRDDGVEQRRHWHPLLAKQPDNPPGHARRPNVHLRPTASRWSTAAVRNAPRSPR